MSPLVFNVLTIFDVSIKLVKSEKCYYDKKEPIRIERFFFIWRTVRKKNVKFYLRFYTKMSRSNGNGEKIDSKNVSFCDRERVMQYRK